MTPPAALRIRHIVCGSAFAGTEKHVLSLAASLRALGCHVELACPRGATELRAQAAVADLPVRGLLSLSRRDRPDLIHVHDGRSALVGALLAALTGAALVRTQHFVAPASAGRSGWLGALSVGLHRRLNRRLSAYICVSDAAAAAALSRGDVATVETTVIGPGVHIPSPAEMDQVMAVRSKGSHPIVLSAGRLEPERRFDVLLGAIPAVLADLPGCEFVIAGSGHAEAELKALAVELGIAASVTFTGWLPDLTAAFARANAYVNTWPLEGFGMATAEAMGFALPVVVADSGASPELVEDGVTGRLVPPLDQESLAATLVELLSDPRGSQAMGRAARARAVANYSTSATAEATLALYSRLVMVDGR